MFSTAALAIVAALPAAIAQTLSNETVLGVYMFHRHGDRTAKSWPPANLTDIGYVQVFDSGSYYRERYIVDGASYKINGISSNIVGLSQIQVSAPVDNVLMNSAQAFSQGLYPPVGAQLGSQILHNKTNITTPLGGYQLIPVATVSGGSGQENSVWLQAASGCGNAISSSNSFFYSDEYMNLLNSTRGFYSNILPVINGTFNATTDTYKNAYQIWDLINVAEVNNDTIQSNELITTGDTFYQLQQLASSHEWGLAYNASDNIRAVAGMTLAGQVVQFLNGTITSAGKQKFGVQFGAYGTFMSFFGLAGLQNVNSNFTGITDYASSMLFELFTNTSTPVTKSSYPSTNDIYVRFLYHNGSASTENPPVAYPLFGSGQEVISWNDFTMGMGNFSISSTAQYCAACGNTTGACSSSSLSGNSNSNSNANSTSATYNDSSSGNGLSPAVNGVIGAMVTLGVILGAEILIILLGGLRVVRKNNVAHGNGAINGNGVKA